LPVSRMSKIHDRRPAALCFGDYLGCPLKRRLNILTKRALPKSVEAIGDGLVTCN